MHVLKDTNSQECSCGEGARWTEIEKGIGKRLKIQSERRLTALHRSVIITSYHVINLRLTHTGGEDKTTESES